MRVLFLTHPEADYGEALLYRGLCTVLEAENVWDFPYKPTYHGAEVHAWAGTFFAGAGTVSRHPWFKTVAASPHTVDDVLSAEFDVCVLGSLRAEPLATWSSLAARKALPPTVVLESEDHDRIEVDKAHRVKAALYFKRDHVYEEPGWGAGGLRVRPLPFSCGWADLVLPPDPYDVREGCYLSCGQTSDERRGALEVLKPWGAGVYQHSPQDYCRALSRAMVGVSVRGNGHDTLRHWEVPFFGALLLTDSQIKVPNDFTGEECVRYESHDGLAGIVRTLLQSPERCRAVAAAGQRRLLTSHTPTARADYFLSQVRAWVQ